VDGTAPESILAFLSTTLATVLSG